VPNHASLQSTRFHAGERHPSCPRHVRRYIVDVTVKGLRTSTPRREAEPLRFRWLLSLFAENTQHLCSKAQIQDWTYTCFKTMSEAARLFVTYRHPSMTFIPDDPRARLESGARPPLGLSRTMIASPSERFPTRHFKRASTLPGAQHRPNAT
jgi:hypothetical protein